MTDDILDIPTQPSAAENAPTEVLVSVAPEAAPPPPPPAQSPAAATTEATYVDVTCPSCGTVSAVADARRASEDFCRSCDYPLFWAIERVPPPAQEVADTGVRRLPGTAGRAALASLPCPACTEPNPPSGVTCVRCGADLHPVAVVEPEPEPVYVEPEPEVEEPQSRWWVWLIVVAVLLAIGGGVLAALLL